MSLSINTNRIIDCYDAVAFDLDGTLLNTQKGIINAIKAAVAQLGYKTPSDERLLTFIGPPIKRSMQEEYGLNDSEADRATYIFRELYSNKYIMEATPYDMLYRLLELLHSNGTKIGVATYKRTDYAVKILDGFGISKYCTAICGDNDASTKTKSIIIKDCIAQLGADCSRTLYIGDTVGDMVGAIDANTHFLAVTYGFGFKQGAEIAEYKYKKPVFVANSVADLIKYLLGGMG